MRGAKSAPIFCFLRLRTLLFDRISTKDPNHKWLMDTDLMPTEGSKDARKVKLFEFYYGLEPAIFRSSQGWD